MTRRGSLQRGLITVLALLMVTPPALLRPCCCARPQSETAQVSQMAAQPTSLPPCCRKRLEAAQKAATQVAYGNRPVSQLPGVHDTGRCGCRIKTEVARTGRAIFRALSESPFETWTAPLDVSGRQPVLTSVLLTAAYSQPPDWGAFQSARLCRWVV